MNAQPLLLRCLSLLALMGFTGCGSARYQINIGNGNPQYSVQNVQVSDEKSELSSFEIIAPNKVAAAKPRRGDLPQSLQVTWQDPEGTQHTDQVSVSGTVREDFRGQLVVEITPENKLTLTKVESSGKELSTLPWALPEAWEGSIVLPGME